MNIPIKGLLPLISQGIWTGLSEYQSYINRVESTKLSPLYIQMLWLSSAPSTLWFEEPIQDTMATDIANSPFVYKFDRVCEVISLIYT